MGKFLSLSLWTLVLSTTLILTVGDRDSSIQEYYFLNHRGSGQKDFLFLRHGRKNGKDSSSYSPSEFLDQPSDDSLSFSRSALVGATWIAAILLVRQIGPRLTATALLGTLCRKVSEFRGEKQQRAAASRVRTLAVDDEEQSLSPSVVEILQLASEYDDDEEKEKEKEKHIYQHCPDNSRLFSSLERPTTNSLAAHYAALHKVEEENRDKRSRRVRSSGSHSQRDRHVSDKPRKDSFPPIHVRETLALGPSQQREYPDSRQYSNKKTHGKAGKKNKRDPMHLLDVIPAG